MAMNIIESEQAQLLEIFKKGAARSTEKLEAVSHMPWSIDIISLDIGSGERFRSILERDKAECLGAHFSVPGERYLVIFSQESGEALLNAALTSEAAGLRTSPEMAQSVLAEIANILISGLSGGLADRQGMARIISGPTMVKAKKAEIYRQAFGSLVCVDGAMVNVLIHISSPQLAADCTVMLRIDSLNANFLLRTDPDDPFAE